MNVPGAGVILTTDHEAARQFLAAGSAAKFLRQNKDRTDIFYFSNSSNSNLIRFKSYLLPDRSAENNLVMELELIDPGQTFEQEFLKINIPKELQNSFSSYLLNPKLKNSLLAGFPSSFDRDKIVDFIDYFSSNDADATDKQQAKTNLLKKIANDELSIQYLNEAINKFINKNTINSPGKYFYILYGLGDNLTQWAGPYAVAIKMATMDITAENLRRIKLDFRPVDSYFFQKNSLKSMGLPTFNLEGYGVYLSGEYSFKLEFLKNKEQIVSEFSKIFYSAKERGRRLKLKGVSTAEKQFKEDINYFISQLVQDIDFHTIITTTIKNYLKVIGNTSNVLVLVPNINLVNYSKLQNQFKETFLTFLTSKESASFVTRNFSDTFEHYIENYIDKVLKQYSIKLAKNPYEITGFTHHQFAQAKIKPLSEKTIKAIMSHNFLLDRGEDSSAETPLKIASREIGQSDFGGPDFSHWVWEHDLNVIHEWYRAGYPGVEDPTKPVLLFGSKQFIELFIYGIDIDLVPIRRTPENFFEKAIFKELKEEEVNNKLAFLHPVDKVKFFEPQIYENIKLILEGPDKEFLRTPMTDFYKADIENIIPVNEFIQASKSLTIPQRVERYNHPVFRVNTKNSNVTELKSTLDKSYITALHWGFREILQYTPFLSDTDLNTLRETYAIRSDWLEILELVKLRKLSTNDAIAAYQEKFINELASNDDLASLLAFIFAINSIDPNRPIVRLAEENIVNPVGVQKKILEKATNLAYSVEITTLPFFKLSSAYFKGRPALLIAQQPQILGIKSQSISTNSFYSGFYIINGWEHEISQTAVESKFYLFKSMDVVTKGEVEPPENAIIKDYNPLDQYDPTKPFSKRVKVPEDFSPYFNFNDK